jgi:two-component system chemotaxis response regulator CheY
MRTDNFQIKAKTIKMLALRCLVQERINMKILIVEDDLMSRFILKDFLSPYGDCDTVNDGNEAIMAVEMAWEKNTPYDLICMDIMMPNMDGQDALKKIRDMEKKRGIKGLKEAKVIMITSIDDPKTAIQAYYKGGATSYIVKPVQKEKLIKELQIIGLIK